jgi:hypothetical protein
LTFLPLPIFHLYPILAALDAHMTPLKNWELPSVLLQKIFSLLVVSMISLHLFFKTTVGQSPSNKYINKRGRTSKLTKGLKRGRGEEGTQPAVRWRTSLPKEDYSKEKRK